MQKQEFYQKMKQEVEKLLGKSYVVTLCQIQKVNFGNLDALFIKKGEQSIVPAIYLQGYYARFESGKEIETLTEDLVAEYLQAYQKQETMMGNLDFLNQKEQVEQNLFFRCVHEEEDNLFGIPHREVLDIAIVYDIFVNGDKDDVAFITVTEKISKRYGWTEERLFSLSMENTHRLFPEKICSMAEILSDVFPDLKEEMNQMENSRMGITVVSNTSCINGFSVIFYPEVLARLAEEKGGNLIIIPSSIHEALVLLDQGMVETEEVNQMIMTVNHTQVPKEEQLSDKAYYYDREKKKLYFMEDYKKGEQGICVKF